LPFAAGRFDLVFCQCVLMWVAETAPAVAEIYRVLAPGGVLVALEPDYGGLIEHPPGAAVRDLWLAALPRAGADPRLGRKLPRLLAAAGFELQVNLLESLTPPSAARFDFLRPLPLTAAERERLAEAETTAARLDAPWSQIAHLPFLLATARRP
jgi:SAM-dependent methyltransferase